MFSLFEQNLWCRLRCQSIQIGWISWKMFENVEKSGKSTNQFLLLGMFEGRKVRNSTRKEIGFCFQWIHVDAYAFPPPKNCIFPIVLPLLEQPKCSRYYWTNVFWPVKEYPASRSISEFPIEMHSFHTIRREYRGFIFQIRTPFAK